MDQFCHNEAMHVVIDEGFLGEEEDNDYEDLYNDVNTKEVFLQSLHKNDSSGFQNSDVEEKKPSSPSLVLDVVGVLISGVGGNGEGAIGGGGREVMESRVSGRVDGFQNQGFIGNEMGAKCGIRVELGNQSRNLSEIKDQGGNDGVVKMVLVVVEEVGNANRVGGNGVRNSVIVVSHVNTGGVGGAISDGVVVVGSGGTILFVGDSHWWTIDAELEIELSKYKPMKEVQFFYEKASGKSKGYH
ncbi:hypothetical protein glysoja_049347 [Glycine soja]|uniref:Uncharacterized protein n=1 Tax=Glycine soja TaxID=3848 RepID=A0A0B2SLE7_GLYSO|nr:hypothetical protein glysoja_049347 [Glycine soja]